MAKTLRVRFYFGMTDYTGKVLNVEKIVIRNGAGSVYTAGGDRFDLPERFSIMEECKMTHSIHTGETTIESEDSYHVRRDNALRASAS